MADNTVENTSSIETDAAPVAVSAPGPHVRVVALDRPHKLNAMTRAMAAAIVHELRVADGDRDVRAVVLTGHGRAFCAGIDLVNSGRTEYLADRDPVSGHFDWLDVELGELIRTIDRMRTPVIAAVNGLAIGLGFSLALVADIRVMARSAELSDGYIDIGVSGCELGTSWLLPRLVGADAAAELILTGRRIGAEEALALGLTRHVVDDDQVVARALEVADLIASHHSWAVEMTKQVLRLNRGAPSLEAAMALEHRTQILAGRTEDGRRARTAKVERRPPRD